MKPPERSQCTLYRNQTIDLLCHLLVSIQREHWHCSAVFEGVCKETSGIEWAKDQVGLKFNPFVPNESFLYIPEIIKKP